jgi:uncharacterized membrane protein
MMHNVVVYGIASVVILMMDILWLSLNKQSYHTMLQAIQKTPVKLNPIAAILAYTVVLMSIFLVAVPLARHYLNKNNMIKASIICGGGVGFVIYALYNLTNLSFMTNYSVHVAIKDTLWGMFLYTVGTYLVLMLSSQR